MSTFQELLGFNSRPGDQDDEDELDGWQGFVQRQDRLRKFDGTDGASLAFEGTPTALSGSLARGPTFAPGAPVPDAFNLAGMPTNFREQFAEDVRTGAERTVDASRQTDMIDPGALADAQALLEGDTMSMIDDDPAVRRMKAYGPDQWRQGATRTNFADMFRMNPFSLGG